MGIVGSSASCGGGGGRGGDEAPDDLLPQSASLTIPEDTGDGAAEHKQMCANYFSG